jgi:hypothetical protein
MIRPLAVTLITVLALGMSCALDTPPVAANPEKHPVKIKVDKVKKKTLIPPVTVERGEQIEFTAESGRVEIIIPDGRFEFVEPLPQDYTVKNTWVHFVLTPGETATISVPTDYPEIPDPKHPDKDLEITIWYLVICGSGADAYTGEDTSPPRMIIPPKKR